MIACEKHAARQIVDSESPSAETGWYVFAEDGDTNPTEVDAYAALVAHPLPSIYTFPSGRVAQLSNVAIRDVPGERQWDFKVSYSVFEPKQENEVDYEFDVSLQSLTVTQALQTQSFTGSGRTAPNVRGGINIDADGVVQGIETGIGKFGFTATFYWPVTAITRAYQLQLKGLAGRYNNAQFYGLPTGEVRFVSARGRKQGNKFPITYGFEHADNETNLRIGDITVASKLGHQYLDVYRMNITDGKKKIQVPHSCYVHTVPPGPGDFSLLGIGTG